MSNLSDARSAQETVHERVSTGLTKLANGDYAVLVYVPVRVDGVQVIVRQHPENVRALTSEEEQ